MKDIRFNISLYIIVPVIFTGIVILSVLIIYRLTSFYMAKGISPLMPVTYSAALLTLFTLGTALFIVKFFMGPIKRFMSKTRQNPVVQTVTRLIDAKSMGDDMSRFTRLFDQFTELLDKVEAKQLFPEMAGQSNVMRQVFNQVLKVAATDSTVLIMGETGTGKELVARSIHRHSSRHDHPFVAINCAAIPKTLLESELFGYEKGAFTGAVGRKVGKLEHANGGTVFLDEIGDMPLKTQARVLRCIQEGTVERIGGVKTVKIDVRFIAATNKNLSHMVSESTFRHDLFFRLNVFSIILPALCDRREDIPLLVQKLFKQLKKSNITLSPEAMQVLMTYDWPGNVRELKNALESASIVTKDTILPQHLPLPIHTVKKEVAHSLKQNTISPINGEECLDERLKEIEKNIILEALSQTEGVQVSAARILGIKERSLWHRIKKYHIDVASFKGIQSNK